MRVDLLQRIGSRMACQVHEHDQLGFVVAVFVGMVVGVRKDEVLVVHQERLEHLAGLGSYSHF